MNLSFESDKENCCDLNIEPSLQFNDTMEEVDYMLKKGLEYMASDGSIKNKSDNTNCGTDILVEKPVLSMSKIPSVFPAKSCKSSTKKSASKVNLCAMKSGGKAANSSIRGTMKKTDRFAVDIKPFPKLDLFAKPINKRQRELSNKQFSHVVSPIRTYVKNTAVTPLMANLKCRNTKADVLNSTAFQELERESRLYKSQLKLNAGVNKLPGLNVQHKPLPRKAYISSELKHVVDERTPTTIPGGEKIQKYIENARMPAVVRHEGKLKIIAGKDQNASSKVGSLKWNKKTDSTNAIQSRNNGSLANLSVMSGDVSMYTIKDAQKF
uniref:Uncharacterized protein n=1 Tax=Glossina brevipalpis TaxID=37001 RepID=A0A1A9VZI2_9MUSC